MTDAKAINPAMIPPTTAAMFVLWSPVDDPDVGDGLPVPVERLLSSVVGSVPLALPVKLCPFDSEVLPVCDAPPAVWVTLPPTSVGNALVTGVPVGVAVPVDYSLSIASHHEILRTV